MAHCSECNHSIFNALWGEFRCDITKRTVYNPSVQADICKDFDKGIYHESAGNKLYDEKMED